MHNIYLYGQKSEYVVNIQYIAHGWQSSPIDPQSFQAQPLPVQVLL